MTELRYSIVVEPLSESDGGGFVAFVPDLPGCMSDGESPEEALANITDVDLGCPRSGPPNPCTLQAP